MRAPRPAIAILVLGLVGAGCGGGHKTAGNATIVVNAPFGALPSVATPIERGTRLAADQINAAGGVRVGGHTVHLSVKRMDDGLSPATAAQNVRLAVQSHAVAIVDEGIGVDTSWSTANAAGVPIGVVYEGGAGVVDVRARPNVFRIGPTDHGIAFRLAEYLVPKALRIAIVHDDSSYGADGAAALDRAFARDRSSIVATLQVPAQGGDPAPQLLDARNRGATALLVWARPGLVAAVLRAARSSGWTVPVFAATSGEDPLVRQELADHPDWVEGLTFTLSRLTSEKGAGPFDRFRAAYEKRYGAELVGVRSGGRAVVQPPDWAMYPYDFVRLVAAAMAKAGVATPDPRLVKALEQVEIEGANGDERSFNERNHEGVVDDDIFFARIHDMTFEPVHDDALSATLPPVPQTK